MKGENISWFKSQIVDKPPLKIVSNFLHFDSNERKCFAELLQYIKALTISKFSSKEFRKIKDFSDDVTNCETKVKTTITFYTFIWKN